MITIELDELPKSSTFIKSAFNADKLTRKTGLEHGFTFCKPKDEIIIDKMCVGTECEINIQSDKCKNNENSFHTHPNRQQSNYSYGDIVHALDEISNKQKEHIMCVSGDKSDYIRCDKMDTSAITPQTINLSYLTEDDNPSNDNMLFLMNSNFIEFNKKTKEIEFEGNKHNIAASSMKRFIKEQKKKGIH